jgi:ubiquinone biosynthesis UbiH/UbiF/VisC/COQ6 family hydroxylase
MGVQAARPVDVAIAGGGLVGAALARALSGMHAALICREHQPESAPPGFDSRVYAVSPGNAAFLAQLGAWDAIEPARKTPVHAMRVYGDDGESLIEFDAYRTGCAELAWIVEDRLLQKALWHGLERQDALALYPESAILDLDIAGPQVSLSLADGRRLAANLVVGADGARSFVRKRAGIAGDERPYGQTAVVANFACTRPHRNVAYQWFLGGRRSAAASGGAGRGAVLALLPLPGDHASMVWSTSDAEAARLCALDGTLLAREVAAVARHALGELSLVTPPRGFPLQRLSAARLAAPRIALAGDAAHVIHPLAGQGANLGLRDARTLADVLAGREPGRDPGDLRLLRRYERARAEDILAMDATVHGLYRLFDARGSGIARLRNAGLNLADRLPVIKNLLMRHAMG